ncbi:MAG TPA: fused MFS/spermidine synthase [Methylotenera sp.]|nr:fused MFS/spermidine synthase [Methylotenera sp.]
MTNATTRLKSFIEQFNKASTKKSQDDPFVFDEDATRSLHFDVHNIQSVMLKSDTESLVLSYTRTMMGFLLFKPEPERIAMIGLGGGSLAKYCAKYLPDAHFTAVEINPNVIAIRDKFHIPVDSGKFSILQADGADYVANKIDKVDVLLVDGFDENGQPAKLCSAGFYDNCYAKLNEGGVMVVNLHGSNIKFGTFTSRIRDSFDDKVVVVDCEVDSNKIAFAYKGKDFPVTNETLIERINILGPKHPIALHTTAQKIQQRLNTHIRHSEWEHVARNAF